MLHKFRDNVSGGSGEGALKQPPYVIRASDLDKNFAQCYPIPQDGGGGAYSIRRPTDEGYTLEGAALFDVCENGRPVKYRFFAAREPTS